MSSAWGAGDINAISDLAGSVHTAYNDRSDYKHVADKAKSLKNIIVKVGQHFESTNLSGDDRLEGQEALEGCKILLENLISLNVKFNRLPSNSTSLDFKKVKLGLDDIKTLSERLTSNIDLINRFNQRFIVSTIII